MPLSKMLCLGPGPHSGLMGTSQRPYEGGVEREGTLCEFQ